jgi:hypothetical protein
MKKRDAAEVSARPKYPSGLPLSLAEDQHMNVTTENGPAKMIFWHRELPPPPRRWW